MQEDSKRERCAARRQKLQVWMSLKFSQRCVIRGEDLGYPSRLTCRKEVPPYRAEHLKRLLGGCACVGMQMSDFKEGRMQQAYKHILESTSELPPLILAQGFP